MRNPTFSKIVFFKVGIESSSTLAKMQMLGPHPGSRKLEPWAGPENLHLAGSPGNSSVHQKFVKHFSRKKRKKVGVGMGDGRGKKSRRQNRRRKRGEGLLL